MALIRPRAPGSARTHYAKPPGCQSCSLADKGQGFVPSDGPDNAPILIVSEAPGFGEIADGRPMVGPAGAMLTRLLRMAGIEREAIRIANSIQCCPPKMWLVGAPWYHTATQSCRQYTDPVIGNVEHQVIVPMGAAGIRRVLGISGRHSGPEALHGTVTQLPTGQFVIPTFHPSHLQRGAHNLTGTVTWDLQRALEVSTAGWVPDPMVLIEDPPLDWFIAWVDQLLAAIAADPYGTWCTVDIETPDTQGANEDELGEDDQSYRIDRVNFSAHPDEGITVPYVGAYIAQIERVLKALTVGVFWFGDYDKPRLAAAGHTIPPVCHDGLWMWKMLQSDLPGALGFVAPFYSRFGAWKHLAKTEPVRYAAIDGPQELRCAFGMAADLTASGQWLAYERHQRRLDQYVLKPCSEVGVPVDRARLEAFRGDLTTKARRLLHALQGHVPDAIRPLTPRDGLTRPPDAGAVHTKGRATTTKGVAKKEAPDPLKQDLYALGSVVVERRVPRLIKVCTTCAAQEISTKHRCADKTLIPDVQLAERSVTRWFWQEPFNPDSPPQILAWLKHMQHPVGKSKTSDESTDKKTLEANLTKTKHPFYRLLLDYRAIKKVLSTYVLGTLARLDEEDRLHPRFTFKPSTQRLSAAAPNVQNVVSGRDNPDGTASLASGFRHCIIAPSSHRLLEVDFRAIESVLTGWFGRDAEFMRLAKLGVHDALTSHVVGRPYDPTWSDADISAYFAEIKEREPVMRGRCKRIVHASSYGMTPHGMMNNYPETFPTIAVAKKYQDIFFQMAPTVKAWQKEVQKFAYDHGYLGGPGAHPFAYKHWFWAVAQYKKISEAQAERRSKNGNPVAYFHGQPYAVELGEDAKRAIAYFPQSTAAGILKEAMLRLFDPDEADPFDSYLGAIDGVTVLRAPIHDSLLLEVPCAHWDRVLEVVVREMQRPVTQMPLPAEWGMGEFLTVEVEAKAGKPGASWADLKVVGDLPAMESAPYEAALSEDEDDAEALRVSVA